MSDLQKLDCGCLVYADSTVHSWCATHLLRGIRELTCPSCAAHLREVERLKVEVESEQRSGDMHRELNRRVADALGKPRSGTGSSWHDLPEQVAALKAQLDALTREHAQLKAAQTWRDIETAPKEEESPVLLWTPHTMAVGSFRAGEWWILGARGMVIEATHWMPLPSAPAPPTE